MDRLHELCAKAVESVVVPMATSGLMVAFLSLMTAVARLIVYITFGTWQLSGCSWMAQPLFLCHQQDFIGWFFNLDVSLSLGIVGLIILCVALAGLTTVSAIDFFLTIFFRALTSGSLKPSQQVDVA